MRPHWLLLRLDCSRVECRIPLANSLEAEKTVLMTRNNELESRLIQLGKNISAASITARSTVTVTPDAIEAISNSMSSENTFKPVHTRVMLQMEGANERQTSSTEALQQSVQKNLANARGYYEKKLINSMRTELNAVHEEYSLVQEKIIQMGCVNFELEDQLKNAKEKLRNAEVRVQQAEEQAEEARQNCVRQKKYWESLQFEFLAKLSIAEKEISDLKEELDLKNEQLKARTIQNNKRNEELKQWRFAIDEIEAVHTQIKMLEKQLNNEKAAMQLKWAEVRTILLKRKRDMSPKASAAESIIDGEQNTVDQFKQTIDTVDDLKSASNKPAKQLEFDKTERRKLEPIIRQFQADKKALLASSMMKNNDGEQQHIIQYEAQLIGLQRQRDFMDHEMTLLCNLNNSKDVLIRTLQARFEDMRTEKSELLHSRYENDKNEDRNSRIEHLQTHIEIIEQEKSGVLKLLAKKNAGLQEDQMHAERVKMGCNQLQLQLQFSQLQQAQQQIEVINSEKNSSMPEESTDGAINESIIMEMKARIERCTATLQQKNTELQKVLNENEALKIKCIESTAALDLLSNELERRSQEKDDIIEMLQSQHTYLTQTILLKEKNEKQLMIPPTISESMDMDTEPRCTMQNASTVVEKVVQYRETQTMTDFHFSETAGAKEQSSGSLCKDIRNNDSVESKNQKICQCLNESNQMAGNLADEVRQLMILNAELETAVEVLKGEIWTLNEQLKESLVDREDLSEKLCEISQRHEEEIERARERERDLEEQKDMAERSQRQAALAENESNRRLVEWQEKSAQMENSRIELENSYTKLSEYYQQLQQAYNVLYAQHNALKTDSNTQTIMDSNTLKISEEIPKEVEYLKSELAQKETELEDRTIELQLIRDLLREHLHVILKSVRDLREMNLKLLKDFINNDMQTVQTQLQEDLKEVRSYIEKVIVSWLEKKELKNAEFVIAVQQLINGALTEDISQTHDLSLSVIVNNVSEKFSEKESENATLKNDLWDEKSDKAAFKMEMQESASGREKELGLKVKKLENLLQITQHSLAEHVIRCQQLQTKLDLDLATDRSGSPVVKRRSGSDLWNCSTPCTICRELRQTRQPAPTSQLQLAILAARLTTKIADNDALFRCNAELAQTNLRLQNEIDKLKEQMAMHITSSDNISSATNQQSAFEQRLVPKQPSNQSLEQKVVYIKDREQMVAKDFDAKYTTTNEVQKSSSSKLELQEQNRESLEKKTNAAQKYSSKFEEEDENTRSNAEKLENCVEVSKVYYLELENQMEQLEDGFTTRHKNAKQHQKLKIESTESLKRQKDTMKGKLEEDKHKTQENDWISNDTWKHFQTSLEEQLQNILQDDTIEGDKIQLLQELKQQLIEELEEKFDVRKEYSMILEMKNFNMEQEITDQKKNQNTQMNESRRGEIDLDQQLVQAQKEITELKQKLDQMAEGMAKGTDHPEKSIMENMNATVEMHSKPTTSSTMMFGSPVITENCCPLQKVSFKPALQGTTHYLHQINDDKLRRRKGGVSGLQSAEKI
ncbi:Coiled-coil domain-containing protein [Dirofilaria immitis]